MAVIGWAIADSRVKSRATNATGPLPGSPANRALRLEASQQVGRHSRRRRRERTVEPEGIGVRVLRPRRVGLVQRRLGDHDRPLGMAPPRLRHDLHHRTLVVIHRLHHGEHEVRLPLGEGEVLAHRSSARRARACRADHRCIGGEVEDARRACRRRSPGRLRPRWTGSARARSRTSPLHLAQHPHDGRQRARLLGDPVVARMIGRGATTAPHTPASCRPARLWTRLNQAAMASAGPEVHERPGTASHRHAAGAAFAPVVSTCSCIATASRSSRSKPPWVSGPISALSGAAITRSRAALVEPSGSPHNGEQVDPACAPPGT